MVYKSIRLTLAFSLLIETALLAQDQSNFTQFYVNPYLINPSYAGLDGQTVASMIYRKQWMNIDGAPNIFNLSLHTPINPQMNVGFSVTSDSRGVFDNNAVQATYGYNLVLKNQAFIRFGISLGAAFNKFDLDKIESVSDQALSRMLDQNTSLIGNAGISFQSKLFHLGMSMPTIFSPSYVSEKPFSISEVKPYQSLLFNVSNRFYSHNHAFIFEPYLLYRLNIGAPSQYEAAGVVHIKHLVWLGGSYKQDFGISALGGIKVKNTVAIGASYTLQNTGENELSSPSFEISLNYLFGKHKKGTFIYSFVNAGKEKKQTHHTSASQAIASNKQQTKTTTTPPVKKTEPTKTTPVKTNPVKTEPTKTEPVKTEPTKTEPVKTEPVKTEPVKTEPVKHAEGHPNHEEEQLKRLEVHAENPTEHHDGLVEHPHAERHEFVKRGSHQKELDVADYVVGGVFGKEENAKHFSDGLDKLGFDTHYGHLTAKNLWYVYIIQTDDLEKAKAERDRVRKMKLLKDAWLLTVHH